MKLFKVNQLGGAIALKDEAGNVLASFATNEAFSWCAAGLPKTHSLYDQASNVCLIGTIAELMADQAGVDAAGRG